MGLRQNIKSVGYVLASNLVNLFISAFVTFIVPKKLGVESYGYFQLYVFYVSYAGFLHLGWPDGIFLRYGGEYYSNLDKKKFSGQFWLYSCIEIVLGLLISLVGYRVVSPKDKAIVVAFTGLSILLLLPRTLLQYIIQGTNRIKEYATLVILEKIIYITAVFLFLILGLHSYIPMVMADIIGKVFSLIYSIYQCRDIIITKPVKFVDSIKEAWKNISVGINLMFANIASMLIVGFVRLSIEKKWDVITFGKVSFTISVSNLLMVFVRAVALVMVPALRRTKSDKLSDIYNTMRTCLMVPLLGMLGLYYPAKVIFSVWLPQYADSMVYMALLFPMCIYESKMSMLIETYMKTLRKEKWLLIVNASTVAISIIVTSISIYWLGNLDLAVISIVFFLAFRCIFAEVLLSNVLDINVKKDIILELVLTIVFIGSSWFIGGTTGFLLYIITYFIYLLVKRKAVFSVIKMLIQVLGRT